MSQIISPVACHGSLSSLPLHGNTYKGCAVTPPSQLGISTSKEIPNVPLKEGTDDIYFVLRLYLAHL